jgi:hypothetical protein
MDLTASPLFAGLAPRACNDILGRMRARYYAAGEHICKEGDGVRQAVAQVELTRLSEVAKAVAPRG